METDEERKSVALAASLADALAETAAMYDRENRFPLEHMDALRSSGYSGLTVPRVFGGGGATLKETLLAQERLARGDGSVALAIGWHLSLLGKEAEARSWPTQPVDHFQRL